MSTLGPILLVEDDPKDVELTPTALEEYHLANEASGHYSGRRWCLLSTKKSQF